MTTAAVSANKANRAVLDSTVADASAVALDKDLKDCLYFGSGLFERMGMIKHPLVFSVPYFGGVENARLNAMLHQKRAALKEALKRNRLGTYVVLHERPFRCDAIEQWLKLKGGARDMAKQYWETVAWAWCDSENVLETEAVWKRLWMRPPAGYEQVRHLAMSESDRQRLASMSDWIEVWHGEEAEDRGPGWSWTLDPGIARWFARRFGGSRRVYKGLAPKAKVLAYLSGRGESEVLLQPKDVRKKEVVEWE